ncbi:GNAT family N-acetyltransferase [Sphingomonas turrisvirgatae]|uniref:GNAT family N-acetyltransferase n=1 Tax=Sphingomonas turrisvirgatae TaxID=1888892 RepID=A0A1E3LZP4_9SPHN|nr:GNAT family N-acetyltransferase [Sphingomonas turrisvirgatae]ODP38565.1 GNAT family N-acetyltransferase [Sphingomonas turrisvirgatae]
MFARTQRLTLRPGWIEDAPELARAMNYHEVVRNLSRAPWPYTIGDAEAFLSSGGQHGASFLICGHEDGFSRILGGIRFGLLDGESHELGYWLTPNAWGRGYATEAGRAAIDIARMLRVPRLTADHFVDNPASGRVLRKLGFRPTGRIVPRFSRGRGGEALCAEFEQSLSGSDCTDPCDRMAA